MVRVLAIWARYSCSGVLLSQAAVHAIACGTFCAALNGEGPMKGTAECC